MRFPRARHGISVMRGFTLLEVLMVVLIVGIISGVAMLSLNPGGAERHLGDESDRLVTLLELAGNEAVMQNREYGLKLAAGGYTFVCFEEATHRWLQCKDDVSFRPRDLAEGLEIHLLRESRMRLPQDNGGKSSGMDAKKNENDLTPDILLLSSGEASPVSLEIHVTEKPALRTEIRVDAIGRITRSSDDEGDNAGTADDRHES